MPFPARSTARPPSSRRSALHRAPAAGRVRRVERAIGPWAKAVVTPALFGVDALGLAGLAAQPPDHVPLVVLQQVDEGLPARQPDVDVDAQAMAPLRRQDRPTAQVQPCRLLQNCRRQAVEDAPLRGHSFPTGPGSVRTSIAACPPLASNRAKRRPPARAPSARCPALVNAHRAGVHVLADCCGPCPKLGRRRAAPASAAPRESTHR